MQLQTNQLWLHENMICNKCVEWCMTLLSVHWLHWLRKLTIYLGFWMHPFYNKTVEVLYLHYLELHFFTSHTMARQAIHLFFCWHHRRSILLPWWKQYTVKYFNIIFILLFIWMFFFPLLLLLLCAKDNVKLTVITKTFWGESSFTGHIRETRRLVVAISLSGSAVSFSFTGTQ